MKYITNSSKLEYIKSLFYTSVTLCRIDDIVIDVNNILCITVHINNAYRSHYKEAAIKDIAFNIYKSISFAVLGKVNKKNIKTDKLAAFLAYDVAGTRNNQVPSTAPDVPHFHGAIFISPNLDLTKNKEPINQLISDAIKNNNKLAGMIGAINIEGIAPDKGSIIKWICYSNKNEKHEAKKANHTQSSFCFPYELIEENMLKSISKTSSHDPQPTAQLAALRKKIETTTTILIVKPEVFFDGDHLKCYLKEQKYMFLREYADKKKPDRCHVIQYFLNLLKETGT